MSSCKTVRFFTSGMHRPTRFTEPGSHRRTSAPAIRRINAAFRIEITNPATGAYTFTLLDQLDHLPNSGEDEEQGGEESTAAFDQDSGVAQGTAFEDNIRLDLTYTVTDSDGDQVNGTVSVNIDDDVPVQVGDAVIAKTVDEDELPGGITDGDAFTTVATGSLASLVSVGADEDGTFTIGQHRRPAGPDVARRAGRLRCERRHADRLRGFQFVRRFRRQ